MAAMAKAKREVLFGEAGKYFLDVSKLVLGGIIISGLMDLDFDKVKLLISGAIATTIAFIVGIIFIGYSKNKK